MTGQQERLDLVAQLSLNLRTLLVQLLVQDSLQDVVRDVLAGALLVPSIADDLDDGRVQLAHPLPVREPLRRGKVGPPRGQRPGVALVHDWQVERWEQLVGFLRRQGEDGLADDLEGQQAKLVLHVDRFAGALDGVELDAEPVHRARGDGDDLVENLHPERLGDVPAHLPPRVPAAGHQPGAEDLQEGRVRKLEILAVILEVAAHHALHGARVRDDDAVPREDLHPHRLWSRRRGPLREQVPRAGVAAHRLEQGDGVPDERDETRSHRRARQHEFLANEPEHRGRRADDHLQDEVKRDHHRDDCRGTDGHGVHRGGGGLRHRRARAITNG